MMQTMLAEQPLLVSIMLGLLGVFFIFGWLQTGKKVAAIVGLIVLLLIPLVWLIASRWETDREQIEALIYRTAEAVENNDHEAAIRVIGDPKAEAQARSELPRFVFDLARVNKLRRIDIIDGVFPPEADVDMSVKVDVSSKSGGVQNVRVVRRLLLKFQKIDDHWAVIQYQHLPLVGDEPSVNSTPNFIAPIRLPGYTGCR